MAVPLETIMREFSPESRKRIKKGAQKLIAEEMARRALRKALQKAQTKISSKLHIGKSTLARLEKKFDLLYSALNSCLEEIGGELDITVKIPNYPPVKLSGLEEIIQL